jgi:hypothetical protein
LFASVRLVLAPAVATPRSPLMITALLTPFAFSSTAYSAPP